MQNVFFESVVDFNHRVLNIQQREVGFLNDAELAISGKCLREEIEEFEECHKAGDIIGSIDGVIDLMYFAVGVLYKMGLTPETITLVGQAVHDANMEKKLGVNAKRGDGSAADAVKPADWVGPEIRIADILDGLNN